MSGFWIFAVHVKADACIGPSASLLVNIGRLRKRVAEVCCGVIKRTNKRDSHTENVQWCKLIAKHPSRDRNRRDPLKIPEILIGTTPVRLMILDSN